MDERRYVVEVSRPLGSDLVAAASEQVASRLEMDAGRIRTLLDGRVGAVTRPVLHDKAVVIARVFSDAGVAVNIREVILEADPAGPAPVVLAADLEPTHAEGEDDEEARARDGDYDDLEEPSGDSVLASHEPAEADRQRAPTAPALDEIWDDDSGWDSEQEVVAPWNAYQDDERSVPESDDVDYRAYGDTALPAGRDLEEDDGANGQLAVEAEGFAAVGDEAAAGGGDARRPRPPQPWRKDVAVDAEVDANGVTLPSTRWVPSPHEQLEREPEAPGDEAFDSWEEGRSVKATGDTGRWWVPERSAGQATVTPENDAPPLRNYLIWALLVSVVVLLGLQVLFALRDSGSRPVDYAGGLTAYRQGDFQAARRAWEAAAEAGDARAQYMLGHMVQNGQGQPWSNARAAEWYRQAAQQGLPEAQVALADLYLRGLGVPQEPQTAAQWLTAAARSGHLEAQVAFGELLLHGHGVQQDFVQALAWFESAAAGGYAPAADLLDFVRAAGPVLLASEAADE